MTNLNKTTKTILFAGLIAAMILPFSGMMMAEAAPTENANDKAKDRYNYKVELLSKEVLSEEIVDGVKITKFKQTVRQTDFPTIQEFKEMNTNYFTTLSEKEQTDIISEFAKNLTNANEVYEIETTKVGDHSITFEPFTRDGPGIWATQKDPINLIFYDNGNQPAVDNIFLNNAPHTWGTASGGPQWTFVDETSHGGWAYWSFGFGYDEGPWEDRYHVRVFNGGDDTHAGGFGNWSIGAAHRETCTPTCHTHYPNSWEISENHVGIDMAASAGIGVISNINIGNAGSYQGINNNGIAQLIQVQ